MTNLLHIALQVLLLLLLAPLVSGCVKNWKAKLQNRRGPRIWQPYSDLIKFFRKDMVISENASWVFSFAPYVVLLSALLAGLLVPMATVQAPLSLFGGVLALPHGTEPYGPQASRRTETHGPLARLVARQGAQVRQNFEIGLAGVLRRKPGC